MPAADDPHTSIPATHISNGSAAKNGSALNRLCHSLHLADNRKKFKAFPDAYCRSYELSQEEMNAVTDLDVLRILRLGCSIHYLANLTGIYGMSVQDLGAEQTGNTPDEFRVLLARFSQTL